MPSAIWAWVGCPATCTLPTSSDIMTSPLNEAPTVSAGPFVFQSWTRDDNTILTRNDTYWEGAPNMDGMIYRVVPDSGARLAQLLSGEIDITGLEPTQLTSVEGNPDINVYSFQDDGYDYIGLNLANPENPQPGQDEERRSDRAGSAPDSERRRGAQGDRPCPGLQDHHRQRLPGPGLPDRVQRAAGGGMGA